MQKCEHCHIKNTEDFRLRQEERAKKVLRWAIVDKILGRNTGYHNELDELDKILNSMDDISDLAKEFDGIKWKLQRIGHTVEYLREEQIRQHKFYDDVAEIVTKEGYNNSRYGVIPNLKSYIAKLKGKESN